MLILAGSLTLHHWQQLAKPHLATILDPHPGVVTKGFCPLPQDAVYHLSDMEEDEADGPSAVLEKGAAEEWKEEEEEEEGGITFKVRAASTPDESRDRKHAAPPLPVPPNPLAAPKGGVASHSSGQSSQPVPEAPGTTAQPHSQTGSTSAAASSSGK